MEIASDQFYFSITLKGYFLKGYFKDEKNQKDKVVISKLDEQLQNTIKKATKKPENLP